ncbi:hypothetical protein D777_00481 [Marinobacter nitratireducens]|uniref:Uncharacterized protein n=1 Tax=Marinobacter nitratireducens TaxID=1137280 RepID=A0A072N5B5_9GAMM|nr:hypothetical protein D777_00481 [Marinobacter nitratireducens]
MFDLGTMKYRSAEQPAIISRALEATASLISPLHVGTLFNTMNNPGTGRRQHLENGCDGLRA